MRKRAAGFTRCTFSGFPCAQKPYLEDVLERFSTEPGQTLKLSLKPNAPLQLPVLMSMIQIPGGLVAASEQLGITAEVGP